MASLPVVTLLSDAEIASTGLTPQAGFAPESYVNRLRRFQELYLEYPQSVAIGLQARCNASCNFCPYPTMTNKGETMATRLVYRLLDEIANWPEIPNFIIKFQHVSEPLLDKRIYEFADYVSKHIGHATVPIVCNGTMLTDKNISRLSELSTIQCLTISFNDHREQEYERVMQLPYKKTVAKLDHLHHRLAEGTAKFTVRLSRVGDGTEADDEFIQWCRERFPLFAVSSIPRADWLGAVQTQVFPAWDTGCGEWFRLRILQNGSSAFCCMDSEGRFGNGSVHEMSLYDIYNLPANRQRRESLPSRLTLAGCDNCPLPN